MVGIILNHSAPLLSLYRPHSLIRQQDKNQNIIKSQRYETAFIYRANDDDDAFSISTGTNKI